MASKGMTWDASADRKLLLGILKTHNISVDYEAMAKYMTSDGQNCTIEAVKNRMKKLKAMAKDAGAGDAEDTPKKAKATPRKRGAAGGGDGESPTKKGKATKTPMKVEVADGSEDED